MKRTIQLTLLTLASAGTALFGASSARAAVSPLIYGNYDTRSSGSYAAVPFSNDGDGSLEMTTTDGTSNGKVSVYFASPTTTSLGALSDLTSLSFDDYRATAGTDPTLNPATTISFRLHLSDGTTLVWENNYQTGDPTVTPDTWIEESLATGNFWEYANSTNYNTEAGAIPLADWLAGATPGGSPGISSSASIDDIELSFGSGISAYNGYIDNPTITFSDGSSYSADVTAVPEPASLGLLGLGAIGILSRRRRGNRV